MSTVETEPKRKMASSVQKFSVEITSKRCSDVVLQSIHGCRLRGGISAVKEVLSPLTSGPKTEMAPSGIIPGIPELPGMQLHIFPASCRCEIKDPLHGNKETCALIKSIVNKRSAVFRVSDELDGVPPREEKLDVDRMKNLVREVFWLIEDGTAKVIGGSKPEMADIENLPGKFLLNAGSNVHYLQPRYEEDLPDYVSKLSSAAG